MTKELVTKEISQETDFKIEFTAEGDIKVTLGYEGKGLNAGAFAIMKSDYFLDKLKEAIPGQTDDKIIDMLKVAFKIA